MHGWMGKILHVNLSNSEIKQLSTQPYAERYLGGRGIASRIYWETVPPEIGAFDPENRLIFMAGPMVNTGVYGASRLSVVSKSPMALPEGYCYGNMGGFVGAELKRAGFDGVVIEGRAPKPVYLWIHDGEAEIRDAASLWGQGAYRVEKLLQQAHGKKVRFVTTGVAGEKGVRTAVVFGSHQSTATAGFGAVMASKNLKALAVIGTGKPSVADPNRLKELSRYTLKIGRRVHLVVPPVIEATGYAHLLEFVGKGACNQCKFACIRNKYRYGGRLEGYRKCQAMEYYLPWQYSKKDEPIETLFDAPTIANDYSLCTFELRGLIDWLYDCHRASSLTEQETGLPMSKIGTREFLEKLLHSMAYREGFGDILAEGMARVREKLSGKARDMISSTIAPIGHHDELPPRAFVVHALLYPMEPRLHHPPLHETGWLWMVWTVNQSQPEASPVTTKVFHDVAKVFWGSEEAGNVTSYEGKALAAVKIQNRIYTKDSLGLCDFAWPITYSFDTPDHVGDPELEARLFSAVTGVDGEKFDQYAVTISNLQRAILLREGRKVPEDDFPPEFNFTEPLGNDSLGRPMIVPGPGEEPVKATGNILDRDRFKNMLKEYYHLRGWNEETGLPPKGEDIL